MRVAGSQVWRYRRHRTSMPETISIVLADDHAVVRSGLCMLLESEADLEVVAQVGELEELRAMVAEARPDVLLLDLHMRGGNSLELIPDLSGETNVLVLTMQDDAGYARSAIRAGASGYLLKEVEDAELIQAVRTVAGGGTYLDPGLGARLLTGDGGTPGRGLTARERDVLRLIALGHTNAEMAERLFLSVRTVETHRANLHRKLGTDSRSELVRHALEQGLVKP
jgi:two-component system, NarL family, response regulator NreC